MLYYLLLGARPESGGWTLAQRETWERYLAHFFDKALSPKVYVLRGASEYGVTTAAPLRIACFEGAEWETVETAIPMGSGSPEVRMQDGFMELVSRGLRPMTISMFNGSVEIQSPDFEPNGYMSGIAADACLRGTFCREPDGRTLLEREPQIPLAEAVLRIRKSRSYRNMRLA